MGRLAIALHSVGRLSMASRPRMDMSVRNAYGLFGAVLVSRRASDAVGVGVGEPSGLRRRCYGFNKCGLMGRPHVTPLFGRL